MIVNNEEDQYSQQCVDTICNARNSEKISNNAFSYTQSQTNNAFSYIQRNNEEREIKIYENTLPAFILTSRFNNYYWNINKKFRQENAIKCIYGSPIELSRKIQYNKKCFVLEMNNDINRIMGIGLIINYPHYNKYKIYKDRNDRYIYKSNKWLDLTTDTTTDATKKNKEFSIMIEVLEELCFYGNEHLKRGNGLKLFPTKYLYRLESELNILKILIDIFDEI
jgi:hypothetical protein